MYQNENVSSQYQLDSQLALNAYITKIFGIMFAGLAITAITAYFFAATELVFRLGYGIYALIIVELILVIALTRSINKISYGTAISMFLVYSFVSGITLSFIFYAYEIGAIGTAFTVTSVTFGVMAVYGYVTKNDLTKFGSIARMFLIGGLVTMLVNMFLRSAAIDYFISAVLLVVFIGLVAYDTQKLKGYFYNTQNDVQLQRKVGVVGALSLYLDFINIFLLLLRLFGRRN